MDNCLFCKIVKGEIPCYKVYENNKVLAFLDIYPHSKGHTLIIPKNHAQDIFEMSDDDLSEILIAGKKIAEALEKTVNADGYNFLQNNREYSGQVVMHYHMHIIPRYEGEGEKGIKGLDSTSRKEYIASKDELELIAQQIAARL